MSTSQRREDLRPAADAVVTALYSRLSDPEVQEIREVGKAFSGRPTVDALNKALDRELERRRELR